MDWITIAKDVGVPALFAALIVIWGNRRLSMLTAELKRHEIRFSKLHERRAEVIDGLFKKLVDVRAGHDYLYEQLAKDPPKEGISNDLNKLAGLLDQFRIFFERNALYLDESFAVSVPNFAESVRVSIVALLGQLKGDGEEIDRIQVKKLRDEIERMEKQIATQMRRLLGVEEGENDG